MSLAGFLDGHLPQNVVVQNMRDKFQHLPKNIKVSSNEPTLTFQNDYGIFLVVNLDIQNLLLNFYLGGSRRGA